MVGGRQLPATSAAEETTIVCLRHFPCHRTHVLVSPCPLRPTSRRLAVTRQRNVNTLKENVMRCSGGTTHARTQRGHLYPRRPRRRLLAVLPGRLDGLASSCPRTLTPRCATARCRGGVSKTKSGRAGDGKTSPAEGSPPLPLPNKGPARW